MTDTTKKRAVVLIPAYKPDERLIDLTRELIVENGLDVLLVDDGGQEAYAHIFDACRALGAEVAVHAVNMGKGRALKTGIKKLDEALGGTDMPAVLTAMQALRTTVDTLEHHVADAKWPLPKYRDMLFLY